MVVVKEPSLAKFIYRTHSIPTILLIFFYSTIHIYVFIFFGLYSSKKENIQFWYRL